MCRPIPVPVLLATALALSLVGCGAKDAPREGSSAAPETAVAGLRIVPMSPGVLSQLSVADPSSRWASLDPHRAGAERVLWSVNGHPAGSGPVLEPGQFSRDDLVEVHRYSIDASGRETPSGHASTRIRNTPPRIHALVLRRPGERPGSVRAVVETFDADGDALVTRYQWRVDGREIDVDPEIQELDVSGLVRGTRIDLSLRASDAYESVERDAPVFVLDNRPPELHVGNPVKFIDPRLGPMIRIGLRIDDPDGDALRCEIVRGPRGCRIVDGAVLVPESTETAEVVVRLSDSEGGSAERTITLHR